MKDSFYICEVSEIDGKRIYGELVAGPYPSRGKARPHAKPGTCVMRCLGFAKTARANTTARDSGVTLFSAEQQRVLRIMADSAGWQEVGGRVMRNLDGEAVGRTNWIGMPDWALGFGYDKVEIKAIVEKAIAGKTLGGKERQLIKSMLETMAECAALDCPF